MPKVSTRPQAGANIPAAAPVLEPELSAPAALVFTPHEQTVADTLYKLMWDAREESLKGSGLDGDAWNILGIALMALESRAAETPYNLFSDVCSLLVGAIAIQGDDAPEIVASLKEAHNLAETTTISYDSALNGAVACADGIRAAQAARPAPRSASGAAGGFQIGRNEPGTIFLTGEEELRRFLKKNATVTASLSLILSSLVGARHQGEGPDFTFIADMAEHVNDLVYQQEQATHLLLGVGGAA